jgi:hypothetical protein
MTQIWLRVVLGGILLLLIAILIAVLAPGLPGTGVAAILGLMGAFVAGVGLFQRI